MNLNTHDLDKIEQTIAALRICSQNDPDGREVPACPICPYYGIHNVCCECLMRDAADMMEKLLTQTRCKHNHIIS